MATTICKAITTNVNGAAVYSPEAGHDTPTPIVIRPDESGVLWYWHLTPEDIESERVAQEEAYTKYLAEQDA